MGFVTVVIVLYDVCG